MAFFFIEFFSSFFFGVQTNMFNASLIEESAYYEEESEEYGDDEIDAILKDSVENDGGNSYGADMKKQPESGDTIATITTNKGVIKVLLYSDLVPETTKNFVELAKAGKYDGVIFHRVIEDFMIQGGDFEMGNGMGGYSYKGEGTSIDDEFGEGLVHVYGALSMANAGPNTGGSQFFIVQSKEGTSWLDGAHAVFGFVYEGMDVVEEIAAVETASADRPVEDVVMEKVEIGTF